VTVDGAGVDVGGVWADDRGNLAARVSADDVIEAGTADGDEAATITLILGGVGEASETVRIKP
jgi:hypothetical protein